MAALGDGERVADRVGTISKEGGHFLAALEIKLGDVAHPLLVMDHGSRPDTDHHVMGLMVGSF